MCMVGVPEMSFPMWASKFIGLGYKVRLGVSVCGVGSHSMRFFVCLCVCVCFVLVAVGCSGG